MPGAVKLDDPDGLTLKQRAFVTHFLADPKRCATDAAIKAGYSEANADSIASHDLLPHPAVKKAIQKAIDRGNRRIELSSDKVLRDLESAREGAMEAKQYAPAVRASELQGKHLRMFADRVEHEGHSPAAQVAILIADEGTREQIADLERRLSGLEDDRVIEGEAGSSGALESGANPPPDAGEAP